MLVRQGACESKYFSTCYLGQEETTGLTRHALVMYVHRKWKVLIYY